MWTTTKLSQSQLQTETLKYGVHKEKVSYSCRHYGSTGDLVENQLGKRCVFAAVPDLNVSFLTTNGQPGSCMELFVFVKGEKNTTYSPLIIIA